MPRHHETEETQRERKKGDSEGFEEERILSTSKELWMTSKELWMKIVTFINSQINAEPEYTSWGFMLSIHSRDVSS